jgi:hypothetical protein
VDYGGVPDLSEYSPSGALLFDAHLPYDMASYRGYRYPWSGRPAYAPTAIGSLNNTGLETIVHMSWNGATGVASWRVLAGPGPGALQARATVPSTGFETDTILPSNYRYVATEAIGASGRVLRTSAPVAVESYAASLPTVRRSG